MASINEILRNVRRDAGQFVRQLPDSVVDMPPAELLTMLIAGASMLPGDNPLQVKIIHLAEALRDSLGDRSLGELRNGELLRAESIDRGSLREEILKQAQNARPAHAGPPPPQSEPPAETYARTGGALGTPQAEAGQLDGDQDPARSVADATATFDELDEEEATSEEQRAEATNAAAAATEADRSTLGYADANRAAGDAIEDASGLAASEPVAPEGAPDTTKKGKKNR